MAFVNSNDKLLNVNIGAESCGSDGGAFCDTSLFKNDRSWPEADTLPGGTQPIPYCFVTGYGIEIHSLHDSARKQEAQLNS